MSEIKDNDKNDISTKYVMKIFHEESMISGFLHVRIKRIRNLMRAWKSEREKQDRGGSEKRDINS